MLGWIENLFFKNLFSSDNISADISVEITALKDFSFLKKSLLKAPSGH